MSGRTQFENELLESLNGIRSRMPAFTETIVFGGAGTVNTFEDFGDGWDENIKAPTGYKGKVMGVAIYGITETFNATTTPARVDVGNAADSDAYYVGGTIGLAAAATPAHPEGSFRDFIPGGSTFIVKGVAPTGGTPAGRSRCAVTIAWFEE